MPHAEVAAHTTSARVRELAARCAIWPDHAGRLHRELLGHYQEPHRRFHTLEHVGGVLHHLQTTTAGLDDTCAAQLAAWYHDVVYDPARGDNEEVSALLATTRLAQAGAPAAVVEDVARLVRSTAGHQPEQLDEAALCDADLAVLAGTPAAYERYRSGVRAEYAHVDEPTWRAGRARCSKRSSTAGRCSTPRRSPSGSDAPGAT